MSQCYLGPQAVSLLADAIKVIMAVIEDLNLPGCEITRATKDHSGMWGNTCIDSDLSGFSALCAVLGKVRRVTLSDCGLGPASAAELSKVFQDAGAVVEVLTLSQNKIGGYAVALATGATTIATPKVGCFQRADCECLVDNVLKTIKQEN